MARNASAPGAIVLGSHINALGVVRSLGRRGIPCVIVDEHARPAWYSRYLSGKFTWAGDLNNEFEAFLMRAAKQHHWEQWVLIPTQDASVEFVACRTEGLGRTFRLVTQPWEIVRTAQDKGLLYNLTRRIGIPSPGTWQIANAEELRGLDIRFPVIVKPTTSTHLLETLHRKALRADSMDELVAAYRLAASSVSSDELMIQEMIPGGGETQFSVVGFCHDGYIIESMTARRTRQYPIDFGYNSSFVEAMPAADLDELAGPLVAALGLSGLVEVEFKHDDRDGQYKLLDVNVRPWAWNALCRACGLDFVYMQYCDAIGLPLQASPPMSPEYGRRWMRLTTDLPAAWQATRKEILTPGAYLRSLVGSTVGAVFDWCDPLPAVADVAGALTRAITRRR